MALWPTIIDDLTRLNKTLFDAIKAYIDDLISVQGVPPGGATNDILRKVSGTDYDDGWTDAPTLDAVTFDTAAAEATGIAKLYWDATEGTALLGLVGGNVTLRLGKQEMVIVSNRTGAPIPKGSAVYLLGAHGDRPEVALANASSETTAARTLGIAAEAIADNSTGLVCVSGLLRDLNTNTLTEGAMVWLATTNGGLTTTRPTQPNHGVFLGVCVKQGPGGSGILYIRVVNGQELDELHDVLITSPAAYDILQRNAANTLWVNTPSSSISIGTAADLGGGTAGQLPYQQAPGDTTFTGPGTAGDLLKSNGTSGPTFTAPAALTKTDDTNVTLTLGGSASTALVNAASITAGWTGTLAAGRLNANVVQGVTNDTNVTGSIATQNLTLGWTGQLAIARGGTGAATQQAALNAIAGAVTSAQYLRGNGTNVLMSAIQVADVPTLNQNTTGSAASLSISGQTGLLTVTGLTTVNRAKTVRDAADTLLELGGSYTPTGTWNWTSATATWPTFNQNTTGSAATLTTARTLTIGNTGKTFNGSANVNWSLAEIGALALTGGTLTGTITVETTGSVSSTRALRVIASGTSPASFGSYPGAWRPTIEIWDNAGTSLLHLTPPDPGTWNYSTIKSTNAGLKIDVGTTGATNAITIATDGIVNMPQGLQQNGNQVLHLGNYNSYVPTLTGTGASGTNWNISILGSALRIHDANYVRIWNVGSGAYTSVSSSVTGALQITLPVGMSNTMFRMTVKVYEYNTGKSFTADIGGYNYAVGNTWYNPSAYITGDSYTDLRLTVRFGYNSTSGKAVIYIGELASTWSYPQVYITDVQCGYSGMSSTWATGWDIGFQSSAFSNVTQTVTNTQIGYSTSSNVGSSVVYRNSSGNFSANDITYVNLKASVDTNYGFFGRNVYADTVNGIGADPLELNYYDGGPVKIGTGTNGSKALYAKGIYDDGNAVLHLGNYTSYVVPKTGGTFTGVTTIESITDAQLNLSGGSSTWSGIQMKDVNGNDYMWFYGSTGTWAIGGGGSTTSGKKLHVHGSATIGASFVSTGPPTNGLSVEGGITTSSTLTINAGSKLYVDSGGDTYLYEQQANVLYVVVGGVEYAFTTGAFGPLTNGSKTCGADGYRWSAVWAANGTIQTSDRRRKTHIQSTPLGYEFIKRLEPVSFILTDEEEPKQRHGLIAQDVIAAARGESLEGIIFKDQTTNYYGLNYAGLVPALIAAIQAQDAQLQTLKAQVAALQGGR